jgi:hypothetical protein
MTFSDTGNIGTRAFDTFYDYRNRVIARAIRTAIKCPLNHLGENILPRSTLIAPNVQIYALCNQSIKAM